MKVLRIITRLNVGGPAQQVTWLTAAFNGAGDESVLVTGSVPEGEVDMAAFAASLGVEPIVLKGMSREITPRDVTTIWKLWRLMVRERPDVVETHTAKAGAAGRSAALLYRWMTPATLVGRPRRCVVVHTYHGHIFHGYYGGLKTRIFLAVERLLARATDRIVVLSPQQLAEINGKFRVGRRKQFAVIPLGLDLSRFPGDDRQRAGFRTQSGIAADEVVVGIVGRLTEIKNHELFLAVAQRIAAARLPAQAKVRFVVIGDGHLRAPLEEEVRRLGIQAVVHFEGTRTDPETFIAGLDILALTSRNEGTPFAIIEAMAGSRPVVSTAVGGVGDLLGAPSPEFSPAAGEYYIAPRGLLVAGGDLDGFVAALTRLIDDASLREEISSRLGPAATAAYSLDRLVRDLRDLYERALAREH